MSIPTIIFLVWIAMEFVLAIRDIGLGDKQLPAKTHKQRGHSNVITLVLLFLYVLFGQ